MPELPEVETVRRGLAEHAVGRVVDDVEVLRERSVRRHVAGPTDLVARLRGRRILAVVRRGKYLWLPLADGGDRGEAEMSDALVVHLGMSGQVLVRDATGGPVSKASGPIGLVPTPAPVSPPSGPVGSVEPVPVVPRPSELASQSPLVPRPPLVPTLAAPVNPHLRVRIGLSGGGELWFVDQRTFGHVLVDDLVPTPDGGPGGVGSPEPVLPTVVEHITRDALDPLLAPGTPGRAALVARLRASRAGIKRALLDQGVVSGIGNIYADEGLWRARIHGERPADSLSRARIVAVLDGVVDVMRAALVVGGTSFDALYVNVNGASGYFDRSLVAYGQAGRPCPRCGATIVREAFMNRSSYRCPRCQPARRRR